MAIFVTTVGFVTPAQAAPIPSDPHTWNCSGTTLGLDKDTVGLAVPLRGDHQPNGSAIRMVADSRSRYVPVVVVHGWTSRDTVANQDDRSGAFSHLIDLSPNPDFPVSVNRSMLGQLEGLPGAAVFTFDYHDYSGRWVDDSHLGPALGKVIDCLYRASGEKVIVVAHSLGGLIARYASNQPGSDGASNRARELSTVVTFGTPETGSIAAMLANGVVDAVSLDSAPLAVIRLVLAACGKLASTDIETGTLCDEIPAPAGAFDSDAGIALRYGSSQLATVQAFPAGITVDALAGNTTFQVPGGWFSLPWDTTPVPVGDLIVTTGSATHGATLSTKASCSYQLNPIRGATDQLGLLFKQVAKSDVARQPLGAFSGACFHTDLMRDLPLTAEATGAVHDDIEARQPVTAAQLQSAPVPAACQHPAGVLAHGKLPGIPANHGEMDLGTIVQGDFTGDGVGDAAAILSCDAGGVAWPDLIALYTHGPTLLGAISLDDLTLPGHLPGENTSDVTISYASGAINVTWSTQQDGDAAANATFDYSATLRWNGHKVIATGVKATTEQDTADTFVGDLHRHATAAAAVLAASSVGAQAATLAADYPAAFAETPTCLGELDNGPGPVIDTFANNIASDAVRMCYMDTGGDGGDSYIVLGLAHRGYRSWEVAWIQVS